jgi:hypothetical protein
VEIGIGLEYTAFSSSRIRYFYHLILTQLFIDAQKQYTRVQKWCRVSSWCRVWCRVEPRLARLGVGYVGLNHTSRVRVQARTSMHQLVITLRLVVETLFRRNPTYPTLDRQTRLTNPTPTLHHPTPPYTKINSSLKNGGASWR